MDVETPLSMITFPSGPVRMPILPRQHRYVAGDFADLEGTGYLFANLVDALGIVLRQQSSGKGARNSGGSEQHGRRFEKSATAGYTAWCKNNHGELGPLQSWNGAGGRRPRFAGLVRTSLIMVSKARASKFHCRLEGWHRLDGSDGSAKENSRLMREITVRCIA